MQWIDLRESNVTDAGLQHLIQLRDLRLLSLQGTRVTDAGVPHLKEIPSLTDLTLSGTQVTPKGLADIRQALPKSRVQFESVVEEFAR